MAKRINRGRNSRGTPGAPPPAPEEQNWMRGVVFEGPEDLAACEEFLRDIAAVLAEEDLKLKRLRLPAGCDARGRAVAGAGRHQG
jgi:hypothetical protein